MHTPRRYAETAPTRAEVDALRGAAVVEFGSNGCGICAAAQPAIAAALQARPDVRHLKVEDGPGRVLGRSFGVRLWPTLVVLSDGREVARAVRPREAEAVAQALAAAPGAAA